MKKILTRILLVLASVIVLLLVVAMFIDKDYVIEREVVINKPRNQVFEYVKYLRNQENFSKWVMQDPAMKKDFRGEDGQVGFVYAWDSETNAGKGEQEITGLKNDELVDIEVRFERPFKNVAQVPFWLEPVSENQTRLHWAMKGTSPYPFNLMTAIFSGVLGDDIQESLGNLKRILEKQ